MQRHCSFALVANSFSRANQKRSGVPDYKV